MKEKGRGREDMYCPLSSHLYFQIDYFNNKIICDLMEASRTGIIALLDEACFLVGTVTDKVTINPFFTEPLTLYSLTTLEQYYKNLVPHKLIIFCVALFACNGREVQGSRPLHKSSTRPADQGPGEGSGFRHSSLCRRRCVRFLTSSSGHAHAIVMGDCIVGLDQHSSIH